ncbi:MAG: DUF3592 domain-containing protein [Lachnospiraceae bacterium]|nr:DUF3592 domain-containing protein [Lachnospiraceae bacterium]
MVGNSLWIGGIVLIILGLISEIAGSVLKVVNASKRSYTGYAEAKVVAIIPVERDRYAQARFRNRQAAVFEFFADGKLIKIVDTEDAYPCPYQINQRVRLSYDPEEPQNYSLIGKEPMYILAVALNILGVLLILGGCLLFLKYAMRFIL